MNNGHLIELVVPYKVSKSFHYAIDDSLKKSVHIGSIVEISFNKRITHGFIIGFPEKTSVNISSIKKIRRILNDEPFFDESTLKFFKWLSSYYCYPLGEVISSAFPERYWNLSELQKKRAIELSTDNFFLEKQSVFNNEFSKSIVLTKEQSLAVSRIMTSFQKRPILLHGVTGSGKTEVYMAIIEKVIKNGNTAIVLVPEISLTPQLVSRFWARFPKMLSVIHSNLTPQESYVHWRRIKSGQAQIVIGARSAVFSPLSKIGVIIVDEEHDNSYKQEDGFRYHARDVAVLRAKLNNAIVVLGSATPSLESYRNSLIGKYELIELKERVFSRPLPKAIFVDLREKDVSLPKINWLSKLLAKKIENTIKENQQVLLYLNKLGFAHFIYCYDCGNTFKCRNCDVSLTYYLNPSILKCHYCSMEMRPPSLCPKCGGMNIKTVGLGTERIEKDLKSLFPEMRIIRLDRSVVKTSKQLQETIKTISEHRCDIIIGTQMVIKGHDFPLISLVGIIMADASLNIPDFRSYERTFQIITQVSGRAGRGNLRGEVVIQTLNPNQYILKAAAENRISDFYASELHSRKKSNFPPFSRIVLLGFQNQNASKVEQWAIDVTMKIREFIKESKLHCNVMGPSIAPIAKLANKYRWHCLIVGSVQKHIRQTISYAKNYAAIKKIPIIIDVDPMNIY